MEKYLVGHDQWRPDSVNWYTALAAEDPGADLVGLSAAGGPTEVAYDKKFRTITVTAHGPGGKRLIGVPEGNWRAQDQALTWDAAAMKWAMEYVGGRTGEAKLRTLLLREEPL